MKKTGYLSYNFNNDRYAIVDSMDLFITDGLHCGECLSILINGQWVDDRIEYSKNKGWYFVYSGIEDLDNLKVKY